jgi:hypothetical protein
MHYGDAAAAGQPGKGSQEVLLARMEAKIDTNKETEYVALKEMQTENERHGE